MLDLHPQHDEATQTGDTHIHGAAFLQASLCSVHSRPFQIRTFLELWHDNRSEKQQVSHLLGEQEMCNKSPQDRNYTFLCAYNPTRLCNRQPSSLTLSGCSSEPILSCLLKQSDSWTRFSETLNPAPLRLHMISEAHEHTYFLINCFSQTD